MAVLTCRYPLDWPDGWPKEEGAAMTEFWLGFAAGIWTGATVLGVAFFCWVNRGKG